MQNSWQQLHIFTDSSSASLINEQLETLGALAVTMEDAKDEPIFEPELASTPLWNQIKITGLFTNDCDIQKIISDIKSLPINTTMNFFTTILEEKNWQEINQKNFKPILFADRLWIYPEWEQKPNTGKASVLINPGLAFGTGNHQTTSLCLEWLANNIVGKETIIDYGCGSGILAIAALKLGAKQAVAVDHDQQAVTATKNNAINNGINSSQLTVCLPNKIPKIKADILIANIILNPLIELANVFQHLINPKGKIVLSGILEHQVDLLGDKYQAITNSIQITVKDGWALIEGVIQ